MFKPMIEQRARARQTFGAVSAPNAPMPELLSANTIPVHDAPAGITIQPDSMSSYVLSRLAELRPGEPDTAKRLTALKAEIVPLLMELDELESTILSEERESLATEHNAIRKQGRRQQAMVERLEQEWKNLDVTAQNAINEQGVLVCKVRDLAEMESEGRHLGRWASDEEIAAWRKRVEKAKAKIQPANEAVAAAVQARNLKEIEWNQAQKELARLAAEEMRLRKRLAGESFTDPEFGLEVPAG